MSMVIYTTSYTIVIYKIFLKPDVMDIYTCSLFYSDGVHLDDPLAPPHTPPGTCGSQTTTNLYHSKSNPDLTSLYCYDDLRAPDYPEHVLKVYKADQTCKYLLIHKETTAHEVI